MLPELLRADAPPFLRVALTFPQLFRSTLPAWGTQCRAGLVVAARILFSRRPTVSSELTPIVST